MNNKKDYLIDIIVVGFILILLLVYYLPKMNTKTETEIEPSTTSPVVDPSPSTTEPSTVEPKVEEQPKEEAVIDPNDPNYAIEVKLMMLGFNRDNDSKCRDKCYKNNTYYIEYDSQIHRLDITKNVGKDNIKNYDAKDDILLIKSIYDKPGIINQTSNINKMIHSFSSDMHSFNMNIEGVYLDVFNFGDELEYITSAKYGEEYMFKPDYIDLSENYTNDKEKAKTERLFYDIAMENNKQYFKYYDYIYAHYEKDLDNLCEVNYTNNGYSFESDYCHGGTSTINYRFGKAYDRNTLVKIKLKKEYFEEKYSDILKTDLNYFNNEYTPSLKDKIITFIRSDSKEITININSNLDVKISKKFYEVVSYYEIEYLFK